MFVLVWQMRCSLAKCRSVAYAVVVWSGLVWWLFFVHLLCAAPFFFKMLCVCAIFSFLMTTCIERRNETTRENEAPLRPLRHLKYLRCCRLPSRLDASDDSQRPLRNKAPTLRVARAGSVLVLYLQCHGLASNGRQRHGVCRGFVWEKGR